MAMIEVCDKCGTQGPVNKFSWYEDEVKDYTDRWGLVEFDVCNVCWGPIAEYMKEYVGLIK